MGWRRMRKLVYRLISGGDANWLTRRSSEAKECANGVTEGERLALRTNSGTRHAARRQGNRKGHDELSGPPIEPALGAMPKEDGNA